MAELNIDIVAVDRKIWSGSGHLPVHFRTTSGEIGIPAQPHPVGRQLVDDRDGAGGARG